jgi:tRNA A-37 threonylcarbamoyl transferase component Bud32
MVKDENQARIQEALGDKYEIKHLIQAGGMGKIYLGVHKALDKKVAIKIIHQELVANEQIKSRFYREAKLAASLDHYGIIDIYDFGSSDDFAYIIMPFIEGETLDLKIKEQGAMDPDESVRIMIEITEALHYAHSHNVIHRDIKPSNIMFDRQGKIIIADFGISKDMTDTDLTAPNTVLGSPRYMSPEQIKGQTVDARSDLYSLGLVFYEMATGTHPFQGKDTTSIYYAQAHEIPPRPETKKPDIPRDIGSIIMKLLDKNPENRYSDGGALIRDLKDYQSGKFSPTPAAGDDATLIDDATMVDDRTIVDDATMVMADPTGQSGADAIPYEDATVVAPQMPGGLPFYKKHIKAIAGGAVGFLLVMLLIVFISSDGSGPPVSDPAETANVRPEATETKTASIPAPGEIRPAPEEKRTDTSETHLAPAEPSAKSLPGTLTEAIFAINNGQTARDFSLWTDKTTYRIGSTMSFHFESQKPCYAVILGYTTQKELVQIFPNHFVSGQFIQANRKYSIPSDEMGFDLQVFGPPGQETVVALVSDMPMNLFDAPFSAENPFLSFNEQDTARVSDFYQRLQAIRDREISQQRLVYTIVN